MISSAVFANEKLEKVRLQLKWYHSFQFAGYYAVEKVLKNDYEILFMDIRMPIMDGITATHEIRKNAKYADLPIVALTANTMAGDKEKYLANGMNVFIPKPLKELELKLVLSEYANLSKIPKEIKNEDINNNNIINLNELLNNLDNDKELLQEIMEGYLEETNNYIQEIETAINAGNYEEIKINAHSIKGSSLNISANQFAEVAKEIEFAGKEKKYRSCEIRISKTKR